MDLQLICYGLCGQTSLLMIDVYLQPLPTLASLHLELSAIRFLEGAHSLDPSHAHFTEGFELL